ncbi:phage tail tape measure protein [Salinicoccus roseus]|uniref:phage tail tape measure protein n=1 Tax=Salinicoccus roseus TaxID=45670 RepID=UPI00230141F6|nr:phage tail tape measure protein [Salinicoccus roseus]
MANEEVRGFNIELGLDHAGVDKGLKDLQRQMKITNSEFDKNLSAFQRGEESMERYETTVEGLNKKMNVQQNIVEESRRKLGALNTAYDRQRQALSKAEQAVDQTRKKYDQLQNSQSASEEELKAVEKELKQAETDYGKLTKAVDKTARELDKSEVSLNNAEKKLNGMRQSLSRTEDNMEKFRLEQAKNNDSLVKFGRGLQDSASDLDKYGDALDDVSNKAMGVGAAVGAVGAFAGLGALDVAKSSTRMQNSLGLTEDAAMDLVETSKRIYQDGFGDSLESVDDAIFQVKQNIRDLNEEDLEDITRKAIILSETFEADVNEVTRAANNLMEGFGIESTEAFDLMAYGAQNGLNFSNELFDNLSEYSTLFGHMGYDADEYFQLLQNGLDAGAYNLDYINDVMKEFQIRIKDSSDATSDAFAGLSDETQEVWRSFIEGEGTVKDVMEAVTGELSTMEDQTKANEIGVQLFGTKFEDLEADAVYALGNVDGELKNVDGTASQMAENLEESVSQRALGVWREAKDILLPLGEVLLDVAEDALPAFENAVETATDTIAGMEEDTLKTIGAIGGFVLVGGTALKTFTLITKGGGKVIGVVGKMAEKFGEAKVEGGKATGKLGAFGGVLPTLAKGGSKAIPVLGAVTTAIGLVGGGFKLAYDNVGWFRDGVDMTWETLEMFSEMAMELTGITALIDMFSGLDDEMNVVKETAGIVYNNIAEGAEEAFNERIVEPFENFREMHREAGETVDVFGGDISEMTTLALEDYTKLSEEAKLSLDELYFGQEEVTTAMYEDVQEKYRLMNEEALLKLQERRENELAELQFLFEETDSLNETERERILEKTNAHYATEEDNLNSKNQRIQEIIDFAMETEGELTSQHYEQIERLQNDHNTATVETLSQGEVEQQAILERMQTNQLATSEETVEQLINDARKAKDTTVSEAETKRDEIVQEAIRQRDETGNLSEEEAQKVIDEAEREYNETVRNANNRYDDVVSIAADQAREHGIIVDRETGDILSKWDQFRIAADAIYEKMRVSAAAKFAEIGYDMAQGIEDGLNKIRSGINWLVDKLGLPNSWKMGRVNITGTTSNTNSSGYTRLPAYEDGTDNHAGGLAMVNDGDGPELIQSPDGSWGMAEGKNALVDMAPGSKVVPADETRKMMSEIDPMEPGAGGWRDVLGAGVRWAQDKVSDIWGFATDPQRLVGMVMDKFGLSHNFTGTTGAIFDGVFDKAVDLMTERVKGMFEATTRPVAGILDPNNISYEYGHTAKYTRETGRYWHGGVDFPFVYQPVRTPIGGTVTHQPFDDDGYGRWLTVLNGNTKVLFAHLDSYKAMTGATVSPGDVVGISGNTGFSTGPHTHFEYHEDGKRKNPRPWLESAFRGSFADGGIINQHGFYEGAEGNLAEMVIPLTKPNRAMELMQQAMAIMGTGNGNSGGSGMNTSAINEVLVAQLQNQKIMIDEFKQMIQLLTGINMKDFGVNFNQLKNALDEDDYTNHVINRIQSG